MGPGPKAARHPALVLLALNCILFVLLVHSFELFARLTDPRRGLPPDGGGSTWGHPVARNSLGFRAPELQTPKPPGTLRVLALGDSLTWGVGVAEEARYTDILAGLLAARVPTAGRVEVVNLGLPGASTVAELGTLRRLGDRVQPDVVVLGFCLNDPQPRGHDWSPERERFAELLGGLPLHPDQAGLAAAASRLRSASFAVAERLALLPTWVEALDRTYAPASEEWRAFLLALEGIASHSRDRGLPQPLFAVLATHRKGSGEPEAARVFDRWYSQAARAASARGFTVVEFDRRIAALPPGTAFGVNAVDAHPSAALHRVYAEGLADPVAAALVAREPGAAPR